MKPLLNLIRLANLLILFAIILTQVLALSDQFLFHDLPCPLCLLQRAGFFCIAIGLLMNLHNAFKPSHYAFIILSGLLTAAIALRQVALHVLPNTGAYGDALFGLHLYTWSFIAAMMIVIGATLLLTIDFQFTHKENTKKRWPKLTHTLFSLIVLLVLVNIISVIFECGFKTCPDNPASYELFSIKAMLKFL